MNLEIQINTYTTQELIYTKRFWNILNYLNTFLPYNIFFLLWSICCERWLTHSLLDWKWNKSMFFFKPRRLTKRSFYNIYLSLIISNGQLFITCLSRVSKELGKFLWLTFMRSLFLVGVCIVCFLCSWNEKQCYKKDLSMAFVPGALEECKRRY